MFCIKRSLIQAMTAIALTWSASVHASIIFTPGNVPQPDENVVFNGAGTISGPALTVTGRTNVTSNVVKFTSSENLVTPASGQARVEALDGEFNDLMVEVENKVFTSLIFNLIVDNLSGNPPGRTATITVNKVGGPATSYTHALGNGNNFLTITATAGDLMTSVGIFSLSAILDGRQFRVGGMQDVPTDVPEPSALLLLCAGLLGMALISRKANPSRPS